MIDILLNSELDLQIDPVTGEFLTGESTYQHQKLLLVCDKNDFKEAIGKGVGIFSFLHDENKNDQNRAIRIEFGQDGMDVQSIATVDGKLKIKAPYAES